MEKLIELLNEYEWNWFISISRRESIFDNDLHYHYRLQVISKSYWFIKWLVEKDKIDIDAYKTVYSGDLDKRKTLIMSSGWDEFYQVTEHWVYESLIMLLSISDTPIDDLISYIK